MFQRTIIIATAVTALLAVSVFGQGLRGRAAGRAGGPAQRIEKLQKKLNLTDTQMSGIRALAETRRQEMQSLRQELKPKRQALRQSMQENNPNPADVGTAALALKDTGERRRDINQRFLSGVKGLLTPAQLQELPKRLR
jgi:Spy/CpxP family protein refolding chaperone